MQIVIDIKDETYKHCKEFSFLTVKQVVEVEKAIKNGIPLPEEHGRLGDLSELEERISNFISHDENIIDEKIVSREKFILDGIKNTLTIIEADKEGKNEN